MTVAEPHRRGDGGLLRRMPRLVAAPADPGTCVVARPGGAADPRVQRPLPEARLVGQPRRVHSARDGLVARVQRPLRPPVRVDMVQSEDEAMVCRTPALNSLHYFVPETLDGTRKGMVLRFLHESNFINEFYQSDQNIFS